MRLLTKWMTCSLMGGLPFGGRRPLGLRLGEGIERAVRQALRLVAPVDHDLAGQLDGLRIRGVQEKHGRGGSGIEALLAHAPQQIAHGHGDVAEIDVDRAGRLAFVADRAVIGHIRQFVPMLDRDAAAGLLFVEKGLDQQRGGQNLVARRVQQIGARHMGGADRLALAAAQAVLDGIGDRADVRLLHDQRFMSQQAEARRVGAAQIAVRHQLVLVEAPVAGRCAACRRGTTRVPPRSGIRAW